MNIWFSRFAWKHYISTKIQVIIYCNCIHLLKSPFEVCAWQDEFVSFQHPYVICYLYKSYTNQSSHTFLLGLQFNDLLIDQESSLVLIQNLSVQFLICEIDKTIRLAFNQFDVHIITIELDMNSPPFLTYRELMGDHFSSDGVIEVLHKDGTSHESVQRRRHTTAWGQGGGSSCWQGRRAPPPLP